MLVTATMTVNKYSSIIEQGSVLVNHTQQRHHSYDYQHRKKKTKVRKEKIPQEMVTIKEKKQFVSSKVNHDETKLTNGAKEQVVTSKGTNEEKVLQQVVPIGVIDNEEERESPGVTDASSEVKILQEAVSIVAKLQVVSSKVTHKEKIIREVAPIEETDASIKEKNRIELSCSD